MGFIQCVDMRSIRSPQDMARALRAVILDVFDPETTRIYPVGHFEAEADYQPREFTGRDRGFIVADDSGSPLFRVVVVDEEWDVLASILDAVRQLMHPKEAIPLLKELAARQHEEHCRRADARSRPDDGDDDDDEDDDLDDDDDEDDDLDDDGPADEPEPDAPRDGASLRLPSLSSMN
jgi:hypothetical protein